MESKFECKDPGENQEISIEAAQKDRMKKSNRDLKASGKRKNGG